MRISTGFLLLGLCAVPSLGIVDANVPNKKAEAVKPNVDQLALETLLRTASDDIAQAAKTGQFDTEINTAGYSVHTIQEAMGQLDKKHYFVDFYLPHSLYVKWS